MTFEELQKAINDGRVKLLDKPQQKPRLQENSPSLDEFIIVLSALRKLKQPLTTAPTRTPKNLLEQFEIVDDSGTLELHFWINKTVGWKKATLS